MKILAILFTIIPCLALAQGHDVGNGGGIHFCPNRNAQELYDLYEGRVRYDLDIAENYLYVDEQVELVLNKLAGVNPTLAAEVKTQIIYMLKFKHFLMRYRINLLPVPDANFLIVDEGCEYKQLANWDDVTNNVLVKGEYYETLSEFHKAALLVHEALYKVVRTRFNEPNSDKVRRTVAELFSTKESITNEFRIPYDNLISSSPAGMVVSQQPDQQVVHVFLGTVLPYSQQPGIVKVSIRELVDYENKIAYKKVEIERFPKDGSDNLTLLRLQRELNSYEHQVKLLKEMSFQVPKFCEAKGNYFECLLMNGLTLVHPGIPKTSPFEKLNVDLLFEPYNGELANFGASLEIRKYEQPKNIVFSVYQNKTL